MFDFILLLLIAAAAQLAGGILTWIFVKKLYRNLKLVVAAEMALMLVVSLLLVKEGLGVTSFAAVSLLAGAVALGALDKMLPHKHETRAGRLGALVFVAMCFHEFPEGIAFGSAYLIDPSLGMAAAALIVLHNLPEGSIISIPHFTKRRLVGGLKAVLLTQLLYIVGGLTAYGLLISVSQQFQALSMAFAAGAMLYIIGEEFLLLRKG